MTDCDIFMMMLRKFNVPYLLFNAGIDLDILVVAGQKEFWFDYETGQMF